MVQVLQLAQLACGVGPEGQGQVLRAHAAPVVGDADAPGTTLHEVQADLAGPGVQGVLQELLDHRCRAFDYLPGGDLVPQDIR